VYAESKTANIREVRNRKKGMKNENSIKQTPPLSCVFLPLLLLEFHQLKTSIWCSRYAIKTLLWLVAEWLGDWILRGFHYHHHL